MLYTSKNADKLLKTLQTELTSLEKRELDSSTFLAATTENVENVRPEYDFAEMQKNIAEVEAKIIKVKHAINAFNVNTIVEPFGKTIDEMLIYIPRLNIKKQKLLRMANMPKLERVEMYQRSNIIDYRYINFNSSEVKKAYMEVEEELNKAQLALDQVNISKTFEIDL